MRGLTKQKMNSPENHLRDQGPEKPQTAAPESVKGKINPEFEAGKTALVKIHSAEVAKKDRDATTVDFTTLRAELQTLFALSDLEIGRLTSQDFLKYSHKIKSLQLSPNLPDSEKSKLIQQLQQLQELQNASRILNKISETSIRIEALKESLNNGKQPTEQELLIILTGLSQVALTGHEIKNFKQVNCKLLLDSLQKEQNRLFANRLINPANFPEPLKSTLYITQNSDGAQREIRLKNINLRNQVYTFRDHLSAGLNLEPDDQLFLSQQLESASEAEKLQNIDQANWFYQNYLTRIQELMSKSPTIQEHLISFPVAESITMPGQDFLAKQVSELSKITDEKKLLNSPNLLLLLQSALAQANPMERNKLERLAVKIRQIESLKEYFQIAYATEAIFDNYETGAFLNPVDAATVKTNFDYLFSNKKQFEAAFPQFQITNSLLKPLQQMLKTHSGHFTS